jgi:hypothetical protein
MPILGRSPLTARRRECLSALQQASAAAGGPVHYSAIAAPLSISPWTAYDLLRELEGCGLVATSYAHRPGVAVGRTQVAFAPTAAGRLALGEDGPAPEERALRRARERVAAVGQAAVRTSRNVDLAGHLGFWLHQAEGLSTRTRDGLQHLLRSAPEAATALSMFVAGVYAAVASRSSGEAADALTAEVTAFQSRLARTTAARRERLLRSLAALLEAHPPAAVQPAAEGG